MPSPDTYYKEDQNRREAGGEYGLAYGADKNSLHTSRNSGVISEKPTRFDPYIDMKNSVRPGPATYEPIDDLSGASVKSHVASKAIRMPDNRYTTDAPGAGSYRLQSNFGIYSASDTFNNF